jgi:hypothetical protein
MRNLLTILTAGLLAASCTSGLPLLFSDELHALFKVPASGIDDEASAPPRNQPSSSPSRSAAGTSTSGGNSTPASTGGAGTGSSDSDPDAGITDADGWLHLGHQVAVKQKSVSSDMVTWTLKNLGSTTITYMKFSYTFNDANTGVLKTESDFLPGSLGPGESIGGWAAFSAYPAKALNSMWIVEITRK